MRESPTRTTHWDGEPSACSRRSSGTKCLGPYHASARSTPKRPNTRVASATRKELRSRIRNPRRRISCNARRRAAPRATAKATTSRAQCFAGAYEPRAAALRRAFREVEREKSRDAHDPSKGERRPFHVHAKERPTDVHCEEREQNRDQGGHAHTER